MSARGATGKTHDCNPTHAAEGLRDARAHLTYAQLASPDSPPEERKAAASAAVAAGIAAADAACCKALGEHSASPDHRDAVDLLDRVAHGGSDAAKKLGRLLGHKHAANYGLGPLSIKALMDAQKWSGALVEFADEVLSR